MARKLGILCGCGGEFIEVRDGVTAEVHGEVRTQSWTEVVCNECGAEPFAPKVDKCFDCGRQAADPSIDYCTDCCDRRQGAAEMQLCDSGYSF